MSTTAVRKKFAHPKHLTIHLGQPAHPCHVAGKSEQGLVTFESDEDFILSFDDPAMLGADTAFVKAGIPLEMPVRIDEGTTTYWVLKPASLMPFMLAGSSMLAASSQCLARVPGSPNDITVP